MKKNLNRIILFVIVIAAMVGLHFTGIGEKLTLTNLQEHAGKLLEFSNHHYLPSILAYIVIYVLITGFSLPGATVLTLAGGFLYGAFVGAIYVNIAATTGASLAFVFARYIAGEWIQRKYGNKLVKFNDELERNGAGYLLTLRLIPVFPFFMINVFAGLTKVPLRTFVWTTSLGIFPGSLVYAYAGQQLGTITTIKDIFSGKVLSAFLLLAAFALFPIVLKRIKGFRK